MNSSSAWVAATSTPAVGSSSTRTSGLVASARAMSTRCFWPPESWLNFLLRKSVRRRRPQAFVHKILFRARRKFRRADAPETCPSAPRQIRSADTADRTESPAARSRNAAGRRDVHVPATGGCSPSSVLSRVDLPVPFAPRMAVKLPRAIVERNAGEHRLAIVTDGQAFERDEGIVHLFFNASANEWTM